MPDYILKKLPKFGKKNFGTSKVPHKKIPEMIFREQASHGEWCALLVPLALLVSHSHDVENYDQFRAVIIILALAMSVFSFIFGKFGMISYFLDPIQ